MYCNVLPLIKQYRCVRFWNLLRSAEVSSVLNILIIKYMQFIYKINKLNCLNFNKSRKHQLKLYSPKCMILRMLVFFLLFVRDSVLSIIPSCRFYLKHGCTTKIRVHRFFFNVTFQNDFTNQNNESKFERNQILYDSCI